MEYNKEQIAFLRPFVREILGPDLRFNMSGYEDKTGDCTLHNLKVLNTFAKFGIYDYTDYLVLDFYKGCASLYLKYFQSEERVEIEYDFNGWTTSEIIAQIILLTVSSGKRERRRG